MDADVIIKIAHMMQEGSYCGNIDIIMTPESSNRIIGIHQDNLHCTCRCPCSGQWAYMPKEWTTVDI